MFMVRLVSACVANKKLEKSFFLAFVFGKLTVCIGRCIRNDSFFCVCFVLSVKFMLRVDNCWARCILQFYGRWMNAVTTSGLLDGWMVAVSWLGLRDGLFGRFWRSFLTGGGGRGLCGSVSARRRESVNRRRLLAAFSVVQQQWGTPALLQYSRPSCPCFPWYPAVLAGFALWMIVLHCDKGGCEWTDPHPLSV